MSNHIKLGSLDSSRSLQMRSIISFVISLHLILEMLKDCLPKIQNRGTKQTLSNTPQITLESQTCVLFGTNAP